jgi:hypothetical protein
MQDLKVAAVTCGSLHVALLMASIRDLQQQQQ